MQPEQRKQSKQPLGESEKGIVVPESANSDTVPSMRSRKRRAPEPENAVIGEIPESAIKESQRGSMRPTKKKAEARWYRYGTLIIIPWNGNQTPIFYYARKISYA